MQEYRLKIVGTQYAANPDFEAGEPETEQMHARTCELLAWLMEERPRVVLMKEPSNFFNPNAVMARAMGRKIGYVADSEAETAYRLMAGRGMMVADIEDVRIGKHGFLYVKVQGAEKPSVRESCGLKEVDWSGWTCDVPLLAQTDHNMAEEEAQYMLDEVLMPHLSQANPDEVKSYLDLWMQHSLHDISAEAREACSRYIECLETADDSLMRDMARMLKHHRTSMCSRSTSNDRIGNWWNGLLQSQELNRLWLNWRTKCDNRLWDGLRLIDGFLKRLPGELYNDVGRLRDMFSRLYYMKVPKDALRSVLALLLLRELSCRELGINMRPLSESDYGQDGLITDVMQMPTTIGRVVVFCKTYCPHPVQQQTIQQLCNWLRDDYEMRHTEAIDELTKDVRKKTATIQITNMTGNFNAPVGSVNNQVLE